jgi:hypothetical protein
MRRTDRAHRREPTQSSATNEPHQKGLSLIGHCVSDRDAIATGLIGDSQQEVVSNLSRDLLDASTGTQCSRTNID